MGNLGSGHTAEFISEKTEINIDEVIARFNEVVNESVMEIMTHVYPDGLQLSQRLWNPKDRLTIAQIITRGYQEGISTFDLTERIMQYSTTQVFKNAYKVAHTELVRSYSRARYDSANNWNNNPDAEFKVYIKQELSPFHKVYDICDVLEGTYDPNKKVPEIPRHPGCLCMHYEVLKPVGLTTPNKQFKKNKKTKDDWGIPKSKVTYY